MHSNRISIVIGLIILAINVFLLTIYASKQGEMTFSFFFTLCRGIKFTLGYFYAPFKQAKKI